MCEATRSCTTRPDPAAVLPGPHQVQSVLALHDGDLERATRVLAAIPILPLVLRDELAAWPVPDPCATFFAHTCVHVDDDNPLQWGVDMVGPRFSPYHQGVCRGMGDNICLAHTGPRKGPNSPERLVEKR